MLTHKQGVSFARLLTVGLPYLIYMATSLFVALWTWVLADSAAFTHRSTWTVGAYLTLMLCDLASVLFATVLLVRAFSDKIAIIRFRNIIVSMLLGLLVVNYCVIVIANLYL